MATRPSVPGLAVGLAAVGGLFVYTGITGQDLPTALRNIIKGQGLARPGPGPTMRAPSGGGTGPVGSPAAGGGSAIVAAARQHIGKPYVFGAAGPNSFDCSGLITYVFHHDLGVDLTKYGLNNKHTLSGQWYSNTRFLKTVGGGGIAVNGSPGDLVCYPSHVGIAVGDGTMIHAPTAGENVKIGKIWGGYLLRRPAEGGK